MDSPNAKRVFIEKLDGVMLTNTLATMHSFIHLLRRILLIHSENKVENDALMDVDGFPAWRREYQLLDCKGKHAMMRTFRL